MENRNFNLCKVIENGIESWNLFLFFRRGGPKQEIEDGISKNDRTQVTVFELRIYNETIGGRTSNTVCTSLPAYLAAPVRSQWSHTGYSEGHNQQLIRCDEKSHSQLEEKCSNQAKKPSQANLKLQKGQQGSGYFPFFPPHEDLPDFTRFRLEQQKQLKNSRKRKVVDMVILLTRYCLDSSVATDHETENASRVELGLEDAAFQIYFPSRIFISKLLNNFIALIFKGEKTKLCNTLSILYFQFL